VHSHFLEEVAKFRAARRLWQRICAERFGARDPESGKLRFHAQTAGSTLTAQEPQNNIVRVAIQALAAVLGGTQSLHTNSFDEALALPSADAARLALRTQQIIAEETGACDTVDPLGGSWAVEALTDALERLAREEIERIDALGGMVRAIEEGYPQRQIEASAYAAQQALDAGRASVVGLNKYVDPHEAAEEGKFALRPEVEQEQKDRLAAVRARRDAAAVAEALARLEAAARGTANLMEPLLACVRAYASVGETCGALRRIFGVQQETL